MDARALLFCGEVWPEVERSKDGVAFRRMCGPMQLLLELGGQDVIVVGKQGSKRVDAEAPLR